MFVCQDGKPHQGYTGLIDLGGQINEELIWSNTILSNGLELGNSVYVMIYPFKDENEVTVHAISEIWDVCSHTVTWAFHSASLQLCERQTKQNSPKLCNPRVLGWP